MNAAYNHNTRAEDRAPQGCDLSAAASADSLGRLYPAPAPKQSAGKRKIPGGLGEDPPFKKTRVVPQKTLDSRVGSPPRSSRSIFAKARTLMLILAPAFLPLATASGQCPMTSPPAILTAQDDNLRDGVNADELCLTPTEATFYTDGNPNLAPVFVKKATLPTSTDGAGRTSMVYTQPLYVPGLSISGANHNVVYFADLIDNVYAYDADSYTSTTPLWTRNLIHDCDMGNFPGTYVTFAAGALPEAGVLSTPVIDQTAGVMYVVGLCLDTSGGSSDHNHYYLHSLNLKAGLDANGAGTTVTPIAIGGSVSGSAAADDLNAGNLTIPFKPSEQIQRPALLETPDGNVFISFGVSDQPEGLYADRYHGWFFSYSLNTTTPALQFDSAFATTTAGPSSNTGTPACNTTVGNQDPYNQCGHGGGIWMSGKGPASYTNSSGTNYVYAVTGNGGFQTTGNSSESVIKFQSNSASTVSDSFTPNSANGGANSYANLNGNDLDMGTGGVLIFYGLVNGTTTRFLVAMDKSGYAYLLNPSNLGTFQTTDAAIQEFQASTSACSSVAHQLTCEQPHSFTYWNNTLYVWAYNDALRAYPFSNGTFMTGSAGSLGFGQGYPGGMLSISASSATANGILWAITNASGNTGPGAGTLHAFKADLTGPQIWGSTDTWTESSFAVPTVVNGRVYVPTYDHGVLVYANY